MAKFIELITNDLKKLRTVDKRLMSYNIEMTEITGGTFWKEYSEAQISGKELFPIPTDFSNFTATAELMQYYPPINLYDEKLRRLAKAFGSCIIRVSGSWATKTYYDFDGLTGGVPPKGYQSVLTREQWIGVLDFVKAVDGQLLISVSNCEGDHKDGGPLDLSQTKKIFDLSHSYGVDVYAAEFMNEPNMLEFSGAPTGYTAKDFSRDQEIFNTWVRQNYPDCLIVGPCTTGDLTVGTLGKNMTAGIGSLMKTATTDELMQDAKIPLDVFSYHYYNGISERLAGMLPMAHWSAEDAHTDAYLDVARQNAVGHAALRDKYVPNGQMWVTESGDAGGGGNTWASTYLDVLRTLVELGSFATVSDGIIFHNTLASSDYGFLKHGSFEPRPNYFAALLWTKLMGTTVYDCSNLCAPNLHVYCHSRKDGEHGAVYLIVNNSTTDIVSAKIPTESYVYSLSGNGSLRSKTIYLNNSPLSLDKNGNLPPIVGKNEKAGSVELLPGSCTFIVI